MVRRHSFLGWASVRFRFSRLPGPFKLTRRFSAVSLHELPGDINCCCPSHLRDPIDQVMRSAFLPIPSMTFFEVLVEKPRAPHGKRRGKGGWWAIDLKHHHQEEEPTNTTIPTVYTSNHPLLTIVPPCSPARCAGTPPIPRRLLQSYFLEGSCPPSLSLAHQQASVRVCHLSHKEK